MFLNPDPYLKKETTAYLSQALGLDLFKTIVDANQFGTWIWNIQTGELHLNETWANILGYTLSELEPVTLETWNNLAHQKDLEASDKILNQHFRGQIESYICECRMRHKNGSWIWLLCKGKVVSWTTDKEPEWMFGSHQDITSIKTRELQLIHYKDILENTKKAANIGTWEFDVASNNLLWSDITRSIFEVDETFVPELKSAIKFYKEGEDRESIKNLVKRCIQNNEDFDEHLRIVTAKNNEKWLRVIGIAKEGANKVQSIYGMVQDITAETLSKLELKKEKEQFEKIFESSGVGMSIVNLKGQWTRVNKRFCEIFGYSKEELQQMSFTDITHPDDPTKDGKLLENILVGEKNSFQIEKKYLDKNGKTIHALVTSALIRDANDNPLHFIAQTNDLTEAVEVQERERELQKLTQEQNTRLLNFAYIVSHNLRAHSTNLQMLANLAELDEPELMARDPFTFLSTAIKNLSDTVLNLNEVSDIHTRTRDNFVPLNLYEYATKTAENLKGLIRETNTKIINGIDPEINIIGMSAYLDSVFLNLFTNAIRYRHPDRPPVINLETKIEGKKVILSIKDNGIGIDLNLHGKKMFGMYKTFHRHKESRGIGLFLIKNQIEAMDGSIHVSSEVNIGTTFFIKLKYETD